MTLAGAAWEAFTDHLDERGTGDQGQVFPAPKGRYLRARHFRRRDFAKAAQDAELDGLRPHDLRHTAVSLWIAAGADPKAVSARAGHSSVAFTFDQYSHLWPEADAAVAGLVDDLYGAQVAEAKRARGAQRAQAITEGTQYEPATLTATGLVAGRSRVTEGPERAPRWSDGHAETTKSRRLSRDFVGWR